MMNEIICSLNQYYLHASLPAELSILWQPEIAGGAGYARYRC